MKSLTSEQVSDLLKTLEIRFGKNRNRHEQIQWSDVQAKLESHPEKLWSLFQMEGTGGEPDVIGYQDVTGEYVFCDCSAESPSGRRSYCYDPAALESRKEHKPKNSAVGMASEMGIELLDEKQYRDLQALGHFDMKTSSWLRTPDGIRKLGGGIFGDCRYGRVFVYHNGVESYYAARGFRGILKV